MSSSQILITNTMLSKLATPIIWSNQFSVFFIPLHRREFGLERFVPMSLLDEMKRKELRRLIGHFLKLNQQMTGSSKMLTQLQVNELFSCYQPFRKFYRGFEISFFWWIGGP